MKIRLLLIVSIFFLVSCQNSTEPKQAQTSDIREMNSTMVQQKHDEIIRIHDEVMPEMSTMRRYKKKLLKMGNSDEIMDAVTALEKADEAMMDWMANYEIPKTRPEKERLSYLNKELVRVTNMNQQIKDALATAEKLINE